MTIRTQADFDKWMDGQLALSVRLGLKFKGFKLGYTATGMIVVALVGGRSSPINFSLGLPPEPDKRAIVFDKVRGWCNVWQARHDPALPKVV